MVPTDDRLIALEQRLEALLARQQRVEERVEWLIARLQWVEEQVGTKQRPEPAEPAPPTPRTQAEPLRPMPPPRVTAPSDTARPRAALRETPRAPRPEPARPRPAKPQVEAPRFALPPAAEAQPAQPAPRPAHIKAPSVSFEELFGGRILAWLGGIAVLLGIVFFLVMAVSRGWIGEATRVMLAFAGSTALLGVGLYLYTRRGRTQAALAIVATAIGALYLSDTAATALYDLLPPAVGFAIAGVIGATATTIAVRWSAVVVGWLGILGALLAPVFVGGGTSLVALAFMAIALVSATGVLVWQRWDWLATAVFLVSAPQLVSWLFDEHDVRLVLALLVVAAFWAIYCVAAIGYELRVPTAGLRASSAILLLWNSILASLAGWAMLESTGHGYASTAWVAGAAAVHLGLGSAALRFRVSREAAYLLLAIGIALSAIAAALALDGPALVAAWSVESAVLMWIAARTGVARAYVAATGLLAAAAGHTLAFDAPVEMLRDRGFDATATLAVAFVAAAAALVAHLYRHPWTAGEGLWPDARSAFAAVALAATAYLVPVSLDGIWVVAAWASAAVAFAATARSALGRLQPPPWLRWLGDRGDSIGAYVAAIGFLALAAAHTFFLDAPPELLDQRGTELEATAAVAVVALAAILATGLYGGRWLEVGGTLIAIATGALAYLPPIALDGVWVIAAWALEAVVFAAAARAASEQQERGVWLRWLDIWPDALVAHVAAAGFLALATAHTLAFDAPPRLLGESGSDAAATVAVAVVAAAAAVATALYAGRSPDIHRIYAAFAVGALAYLPPIALDGAWVVATWAAEAVLVVVGASYVPRTPVVPVVGVFLALAAAHTLVFEAPPLALRNGVDDLVSAVVALAAVGAAAFVLVRSADSPRRLRLELEIVGATTIVYLPSVAIVDLTANDGAHPGQTPQVLLSAFWSITGLASLLYGLLHDDPRFRVGGLALLGIAVVKVYLYDLAELDEIYRVLSFIVLGLLLLAGAFAYQRIRRA